MATDYIPQADVHFNIWQSTFVTWLSIPANMTRLGLTPEQVTALVGDQTAWTGTYSAHIASQAAAKTASNTKDGKRTQYEAAVRLLVAGLQLNPALTDPDRVALGITVPSTTRHPAVVPTTYPVATIDFSMRLTHSIDFRDMATPNSKARPAGVRGAQIWEKIGGPMPVTPDGFTFLATDTKSPYVNTLGAAEIGQMVYYALRWENSTGEVGPWSPIVSAVVPG